MPQKFLMYINSTVFFQTWARQKKRRSSHPSHDLPLHKVCCATSIFLPRTWRNHKARYDIAPFLRSLNKPTVFVCECATLQVVFCYSVLCTVHLCYQTSHIPKFFVKFILPILSFELCVNMILREILEFKVGLVLVLGMGTASNPSSSSSS